MPLFVIRSICQTKTVSLPDFTEPILKAKKAHFGLLSLGRALVKEEERKAKEKGSSWVHLSVELDLAFVLEGRCFYYMVITGYIVSESILLSLLHVWGTEWERRSKVKSVTISRSQISTSTLKREKNPRRAIQHRDTNCGSWSPQAPACRKSMAGTYCYRQVLFLQLSLSHWATDLNANRLLRQMDLGLASYDHPYIIFIFMVSQSLFTQKIHIQFAVSKS